MKDLTQVSHHDSAEFLPADLTLRVTKKKTPHQQQHQQQHQVEITTTTKAKSWKFLYQRAQKIPINNPKPIKRLTIHVEFLDKNEKCTFDDIHPMDTILGMKERLSKKFGVPPGQQLLILNDEETHNGATTTTTSTTNTTTKDTTRIQESNIKDGSKLKLERSMVSVKIGKGKVVSVPIEPEMPLWEVQMYLEENYGVQEEDLLGYDGLILDEPERTMEQYRIRHKATLEVISTRKR